MNDGGWVSKNKMAIIAVIVLGVALIYVWKTDFSLYKYIQNRNYIPGQNEPSTKPPPMQDRPKGEADWRRQFERDRE